MPDLEKSTVELGYIPLLDCVALLWAEQRGFFQQHGLTVNLVRETSWASLRDRLAYGFLDAAHCLSAMLPAALLGQDQLGVPLQTPLVLSQNRAYISLSQALCYRLHITAQDSPRSSAEKVLHALQTESLQFAHVFPDSIHHYCLRQWLALADAERAKLLPLKTLAPPFMAQALSEKKIDGFCVGEPWNSQAALSGCGQIVLSSQAIIPQIADKVLAVTEEWAQQHPNTLAALCAAIQQAQQELTQLEDLTAVWQMLQQHNIIQFECNASVHVHTYHHIQQIIRQMIGDSNQPQVQDFEWLISQIQHWESLPDLTESLHSLAQRCVVNSASKLAEFPLSNHTV